VVATDNADPAVAGAAETDGAGALVGRAARETSDVAPSTTPATLVRDLRILGLAPGDVVMVHASLKAIGPVAGGAEAVVAALLDSVAPGGTLMGYASWDRSPYEETLNGATLSAAAREAWPAFVPATAGVYRGFGLLNAFLCAAPGAVRSAHPDASMVVVGARAAALIGEHRLGRAGQVGPAACHLFDAGDIVAYGKAWLEQNFG
jgi:aminoglycoside N3'-acetyltransferase